MRAAGALVWSEWHARRWWLVILGGIGIAAALAMSASRWAEVGHTRIAWTVSVPVASLVLIVAAFAVGFSMNYRDIAEYRLGFYLSKPLRGFALWAARYAAGLGLVFLAAVLLLLPTFFVLASVDSSPEGTGLSSSEGIALALEIETFWVDLKEILSDLQAEPDLLLPVMATLLSLTTLLFYSAGFCFGIGVATGSQWRALDVVAACVLIAVLWWLASLIHSAGAHENARLGVVLFCLLTPPALVTAGAVAISWGRMQSGRIHRGLTFTLWPLVALPLLAFRPYTEWVFTPEMEDLVDPRIYSTGTDSWWVGVVGEARWRPGPTWTFLYDAQSKRDVRIRTRRVAFTPDARLVVWTAAGTQNPRLMSLRLDSGTTAPELGPLVGGGNQPITVSPDGKRCAFIEGLQVTVYDLPRFQVAFRGPLPHRGGDYSDKISHFVSRDLLRIYTRGSFGWTISELDLPSQSFRVTGTMSAGVDSSRLLFSPDGRRVIVRNWESRYGEEPPTVELRDSHNGELLETLSSGAESLIRWFWFIADGRIVAATNREDTPWMGLLSASDQAGPRMTFSGELLRVGGEVAPAKLLLVTRPEGTTDDDFSAARLQLADLESGRVEEVGWGLEPLMSSADLDRPHQASLGSPATKFFLDPAENLVLFDPLTGERETLLELRHRSEKEQGRG